MNYFKNSTKTAILALAILLLGANLALAQQQINLTAGPANLTLPDGSTVPMWGYSCGAVVTGSMATCAALNAKASGWSPVVITVPTGQDLQVNLTNGLSFTTTAGTNTVPTSLVIVGQLGGGLGTAATYTASPAHATQVATWPIAGNTSGATNTPPTQGPRVESFSTEVAVGTPTSLTWKAPRPGTYLLESGTHPSIQAPMGLYGIVVVTGAPTLDPTTGAETAPGTAYPGVSYSADIPLLFSEIDPVQNTAVNTAVNTAGFSETAVVVLRDSVTSVSVTAGGTGYQVGDAVVLSGGGGTGATAQVSAVDGAGAITAVTVSSGGSGYTSVPNTSVTSSGSGAQLVANLSSSGDMCTGGAACYPPAVNYKPLYYLINGVAFDKTNAGTSLFAVSPASSITGSVLVRMVNAGLRMHVPSIVGAQTTQTVAGTTSLAGGFSVIAEDGNPEPGVPRVQSEVFMAAGKTFDVMINVPAACTPVAPATTCTNAALPVFDRELSLSGNATERDAGMLAYISVNGATLPSSPAIGSASANADTYNSLIAGQTLTISDPSKGVIANDVNVYGVKLSTPPTNGTVTLNTNGTFTYLPSGTATSDSFGYCANGAATGTTGLCTTVTLGSATLETASGISCSAPSFASNLATTLSIKPPGVLAFCKDGAGYPLTVAQSAGNAPVAASGLTLSVDPNGGFNASVPSCTTAAGCTYTFTFKPQNAQGTVSATAYTATLTFPVASNLQVKVLDGYDKTTQITDYRWIIEEDRTFYVDPTKTTNTGGTTIVPTFGTNFHTSYMPLVATGCTGPLSCESGQTLLGQPAVCDVGNGVCRTTGSQEAPLDPGQVHLDPTKRYYISVLPGDAANPFNAAQTTAPNCATGACGHGMGGAPILFPQANAAVTVLTQPSPYPPAKLSVFVFEDDFPLNGEQDGGGGIDVLSPNEPGLGEFNIQLWDDAGGTGDPTGQMTYDMFNQPLGNSLDGMIDPVTGLNACPITKQGAGITGMIVTCPKYESDGKTLSPVAGQAVIANLMPGRYGVVATPGADRIGRGEEWLQTNTLDGQKAHDSFLRIGEPSFFQEYGPAGYHVSIGFANPAIINARKAGVCGGTDANITGTNCTNSVTGLVTMERMSRTPDERLYSSGDYSSFAFTQCYVSFGDPDGEDFAFTKCNSDGTFTLTGLPDGDWRVTIFDQWNDMLVDGLSTPVRLAGGKALDMGQIAINQWQANIYTTTFFDQNGDGIRDNNEPGLSLVPTNIRFRDGSFSNFNNTDLSGNAGFNEIFPLFSWYVVETDATRYKNTGTHVVYDAGGPSDGSTGCGSNGNAPCGNSTIAHFMANTYEQTPIPASLHVPGAVYCTTADCSNQSIKDGPGTNQPNSTGRIDPPWVLTEGWQGFSGQNSFVEFGKAPYATGENGGIRGHVVYASTRPFDDPKLLLQTSWEPLVPHVTINLYQEGTDPNTGAQTLKLVDTTQTSSWDDWAQGFRSDGNPNMNCPGQSTSDLFYFTLYNQPMYLNPSGTVPYNSQFKCFDGMHNWNQVQPAPYDGFYQFPSMTGMNPTTGEPIGTNCTICVPDPDSSDPYRYSTGTSGLWDPAKGGTPMLPAGKYVVEVVVPPGYELVKEEDKNILIGDNYIAPVTQEFGGLGSIFILPDQATVSNTYNAQNPTQNLGRAENLPSHEGDTGSIETYWPCVGQARVVPDYISLFPQSAEVAPFAGATRNLCDRKEVTLTDQTAALAKFYIFTSTHAAAHFTGVITDDFTSEFDPFSPQFGEKFSPPNLPVSIKDWQGNEISRVYSDQWGTYNGLTYSTWEVNPPNPTGYAPTMMITCMNDPGTGATPDPLFNPQYSQFCYEIPFMPGQTQYMDTPVVPTSAFAGAGYNNPDCSYPAATPAIKEVDGDGVGPWVSAAGHTLTITALGDQIVPNNAYSGPSATTAPYNQKTITKHYGFGATKGTVSIGGIGVPASSITTWTDSQIVLTVPTGVPACSLQQQAQYSGSAAQCGELVITAANGKQSIDTVTVTIGGKAPTHIPASATIQSYIDTAAPGDLLMVDPTCTTTTGGVTSQVACTTTGAARSSSTHQEMLLMWKPVRLQGVGAVSSIINANTQPAGKLDDWRVRVNCLIGLGINGSPSSWSSSCGSGWNYFTASTNNPQVDRLPLEAALGWDASLNGNLAELLQEPSLMGALEGAAITVLSKGVDFHGQNPWDSSLAAGFPTGTTLLLPGNAAICGKARPGATGYVANPYPSNFACNPSSIDGMSITDSSQGGGGIFVHAWGHNLQVANDRIYNNAGTLSGGINVGQGEHPGVYLGGTAGTTNAAPGSCLTSNVNNLPLPYCFDMNVNIHHNSITANSSTGDELFSATPAGAGGVSLCSGADYYKFNYNWVCGNLSTGDGGGVGHLGFSYAGDIEHNSILFNQSTNPTIPANGGGLLVMGAPDADPPCGITTDQDCVPPVGSVGPSDGAGPGLVINANLIMGNAAEAGSGGGLRLQNVNGSDVVSFPNGQNSVTWPTSGVVTVPAMTYQGSSPWYVVQLTNNIIANNVAGWDGAGVSLYDALAVNMINNTIMSNDTTASSGVLFNTLGAPLASSSGTNCTTSSTSSCPQPAGLVSIQNSAALASNLPASITCPAGHYAGTTAINGSCRSTSFPLMYDDVFWQNRSFYIGVGPLGTGTLNQQNVVALYEAFTSTQAPSQPSGDATTANGGGAIISGGTGACTPVNTAPNYWDIGVRGDTGPANHASGTTLTPVYSVLTNTTGYTTSGTVNLHNTNQNPTVVSQYCNGSRVPPEYQSMGYQVPPGISDATVPNPIFNLTPAATVDEGNNWINISWGPLSLINPLTNTILGNYSLATGSPAINYIPCSGTGTCLVSPGGSFPAVTVPSTDFFGNPRPDRGRSFDVGAVEVPGH